jgi:hypothetical protein
MVAINSIPQHEVANGKGHKEFARANPIILSTPVAKNPGPSNPSGAFTVLTILYIIVIFLYFSGQ